MNEKIVIVGGCGHVGLPLGIVLAECQRTEVTLLDIDGEKVTRVNAGSMPFLEDGAAPALKRVIGKTLSATTDGAALAQAHVVISVVGTPVDKYLNPTVKELYESVDQLLSQMQQDSLLILRSTVYPGVTKLVYDRIFRLKRNIHLAFCPERIAEGKALEELKKLPQIIAAFEHEAECRSKKLFLKFAPEVISLSPLEAELAKLFSNSWRYLNFAISNQFYILAQRYGLDFYRIHEAATKDYPRMRGFAKAGFAAGPCLLKDTLQLAAFSGNNFFMGHAAMLINEGLPNFIVEQLQPLGLSEKRVAILGMAFKAESDDIRDSLSFKLRKLLEVHCQTVLCTDPYVCDSSFVSIEEAISRSEIIVLGAPHSCYRELKFDPRKVLVDVWNFWPQAHSTRVELSPVKAAHKALMTS